VVDVRALFIELALDDNPTGQARAHRHKNWRKTFDCLEESPRAVALDRDRHVNGGSRTANVAATIPACRCGLTRGRYARSWNSRPDEGVTDRGARRRTVARLPSIVPATRPALSDAPSFCRRRPAEPGSVTEPFFGGSKLPARHLRRYPPRRTRQRSGIPCRFYDVGVTTSLMLGRTTGPNTTPGAVSSRFRNTNVMKL
jgi:hypothetical protein